MFKGFWDKVGKVSYMYMLFWMGCGEGQQAAARTACTASTKVIICHSIMPFHVIVISKATHCHSFMLSCHVIIIAWLNELCCCEEYNLIEDLMSSRTCLRVGGSNSLNDDSSAKGSSDWSCTGGGGIEAYTSGNYHRCMWQNPLPGLGVYPVRHCRTQHASTEWYMAQTSFCISITAFGRSINEWIL